MPSFFASRCGSALALLAAATRVGAQSEVAPVAPAAAAVPAASELAPVVVTATRTQARAFDVPESIDRIDGAAVRDQRAGINFSESLGPVPGLLARDRQNYAQDVQISVRGFGARSTFGIRGVRLYVDGIPATLPDGQGQITNVDLGSVARIEVLRGPFSALYGNSSGGVIQVFSEEGAATPRVSTGVVAGSDGTSRISAQASGTAGPLGYLVGASRFRTDGYRDHSEAERNIANAKLTLRPNDDDRLTLLLNSVALPEAQDPLGLSRPQFEANPRGVDPSAIAFDTRKTVHQTQAGLVYEHRLGAADSARVLAYTGHRGTVQFQAIPVAAQASPLHPGGVIDLGRDYGGADARWTHRTELLAAPLTIVGGLAYDTLAEHRRGYRNFDGATLGVQAALRRDENNDVWNLDEYLQASWKLTPAWSLDAGVRHSSVRFRSADAYIVGPNPDDSGSAVYAATLPVAGVMFAASDEVHLYATAGRGFETPTLNELAYRPSGATGLNFALQSARSTSVEAGVKLKSAWLGEATLAVFWTGTSNEIVTRSNVAGRSTFQNAGATRRTGLELGWSQTFLASLRAQLAFTSLDARYRDGFATCSATPCATATQAIPAGNRIPGIARTSAYAALGWAPPSGLRGGVEARWLSRVYVNDANSDAAPGYAVAAANVGYGWTAGAWDLGAFVRADNLFGRSYAGSVIVNEGNGRFFEPAPGRTWLAGASATLRF